MDLVALAKAIIAGREMTTDVSLELVPLLESWVKYGEETGLKPPQIIDTWNTAMFKLMEELGMLPTDFEQDIAQDLADGAVIEAEHATKH